MDIKNSGAVNPAQKLSEGFISLLNDIWNSMSGTASKIGFFVLGIALLGALFYGKQQQNDKVLHITKYGLITVCIIVSLQNLPGIFVWVISKFS